ncbi:MAG: esterase [Sandaracinaceae bacterium]|nr:esterase [Sandaracinaceae bacterium]
MHGRIERKRLTSRCLVGNPLGDPHERDVYVYVPPATHAGQRFPMILLLPGYGSNHLSILSYSPWSKNTVERFDEQVARGESPPAILVLPDCMTRWGGSQFVDSRGTGRYQTYLADEVIPFVDQHFPTVPAREARAAAGRSSGGFGALRLALDRPELISAVASHAGDAAFEVSMRPMFTSAAIGLERAGGLAAFAQRLGDGGPRNTPEFDAAFVLAASAAYSPDPDGSFPHVALPFDPVTAEPRKSVFDLWHAEDPLTRMRAQRPPPRCVASPFSISTPGRATSTGSSSRRVRSPARPATRARRCSWRSSRGATGAPRIATS